MSPKSHNSLKTVAVWWQGGGKVGKKLGYMYTKINLPPPCDPNQSARSVHLAQFYPDDARWLSRAFNRSAPNGCVPSSAWGLVAVSMYGVGAMPPAHTHASNQPIVRAVDEGKKKKERGMVRPMLIACIQCDTVGLRESTLSLSTTWKKEPKNQIMQINDAAACEQDDKSTQSTPIGSL